MASLSLSTVYDILKHSHLFGIQGISSIVLGVLSLFLVGKSLLELRNKSLLLFCHKTEKCLFGIENLLLLSVTLPDYNSGDLT